MTTDKMREEFEAWFIGKNADVIMRPMIERNIRGDYIYQSAKDSWTVWQAATAESTAKIAQMQARIDELEGAAEDLNTYIKITKDLTSENVEFCNKIEQQTLLIQNILGKCLAISAYSKDDIAIKNANEIIEKVKDNGLA